MEALIDGDILRYEIGFAAETGWKAITERDEPPPFDYVNDLLSQRIANILAVTQADSYCLYLTEGKTFRYELAVTKPYKGHRISNKPWHFDNLTAVIKALPNTKICTWIEADDAMAIDLTSLPERRIICSRDKDLRQIPGLSFSWELGAQPSFGPTLIDPVGTLEFIGGKKKVLKGTGYAWFCAQLLTGDVVDNIPGCPGVGPVMAYEKLKDLKTPQDMFKAVEDTYNKIDAQNMMIEQAQLLWIVRRLKPDGTPQIWEPDLYL